MKEMEQIGFEGLKHFQVLIENFDKCIKHIEDENNDYYSFQTKIKTEIIEKFKNAIKVVSQGDIKANNFITRIQDPCIPIN